MTRIGVRELRQHASRYLDVVKGGGTVEVTERGHLVALLVPPGDGDLIRDELVAAGRLIPARAHFKIPHDRIGGDGGVPASDVLDELRDERLR